MTCYYLREKGGGLPVSTMVCETDMEMAWTQLPPGPELAIELALTDWAALSDRELTAAMAAARRQAAWTESLQLSAVRELAGRRYARHGAGDSEKHRRVAAEVSIELTITHGQAEELVWLAHDLPDRLPNTWAALQTGQIDLDRAKVMADGLAALDGDMARRLDQELAEEAVASTRTRLRSRVKRAVRTADPGAHAERTKRAKNERRFEIWDNSDDTCDLVGRNMDAAEAHAIYNRLTAAANAMKADGDQRTLGQIRADLQAALLHGTPLPEAARNLLTDPPVTDQTTGAGEDAGAGQAGGRGEPARAGQASGDGGPGELADVIAAVETLIARALAEAADEQLTGLLDRARANGKLDTLTLWIGQAVKTINDALADLVDAWCRHTGGTPGAHGHHRHHGYRPPAGMQRLIPARHPACVFPTCNRKAAHCDLDHTIAYDHGGRTCKCNLAPLCRTHHRVVKQHPSWTLLQPWPGLLIWLTPSGTWHIVTPQ
jgi:hypothetical protein